MLPIIKTIYKEYQVPPVEIKNRIKGVTKLLTKGTDERIVEIADFEELFDEMLVGENNDFDLLGGNDEDWLNRLLEPDEYEWGDEDDERDADALFYKECGFKPSKPKAAKSGKSKNKKQKYALTLDVSLKGSPRKVYRLIDGLDERQQLDCLDLCERLHAPVHCHRRNGYFHTRLQYIGNPSQHLKPASRILHSHLHCRIENDGINLRDKAIGLHHLFHFLQMSYADMSQHQGCRIFKSTIVELIEAGILLQRL